MNVIKCHICGTENTYKNEYCSRCDQKIRFKNLSEFSYFRYRYQKQFLYRLPVDWDTIGLIFHVSEDRYPCDKMADFMEYPKKILGHFILPVTVFTDSLVYRFKVTSRLDPEEIWAMFGLTGPASIYIIHLREIIFGHSILTVMALFTSLIYEFKPVITCRLNREKLDKLKEKAGNERVKDLLNSLRLDMIFSLNQVYTGFTYPDRYLDFTRILMKNIGDEKYNDFINLIKAADPPEYDGTSRPKDRRYLTIDKVKENLGEEKFLELMEFLDSIQWDYDFKYNELFNPYFRNLTVQEISLISDYMIKIDSVLRGVTLKIYREPSFTDKNGERKIVYEKYWDFIPKYCKQNAERLLFNIGPLNLPDLSEGVYTMEISDSFSADSFSFCLSDIEIASMVREKCVIFMAYNKYTQQFLNDVDFYLDREKKIIPDKDGVVKIAREELRDGSEITARRGSHETTLDLPLYREEKEIFKGYIYTDRPVYRPGHRVNFKGIVRTGKELEYKQGEDIKVTIKDSKDKEIYDKILKTDEYGTVSDNVKLPEVCCTGKYYISIENSRCFSDSTYFNVSEYRKPEFYVKIDFDKPFYIAGDKITAIVEVFYYFGKPVTDGYVDCEIMIVECDFIKSYLGTVKTDSHGKAVFSWGDFTEKISERYSYKVKVKVQDPSGHEVEECKYIFIYHVPYRLRLSVDKILYELGQFGLYRGMIFGSNRYYIKKGDTFPVIITADDHSDKPVETEVILRITNDLSEEVYRKTLNTDKDGIATCEYSFDRTGTYTLEGFASENNNIKTSGPIYCYSPDEYDRSIKILIDKKIVEQGDRLNVIIKFPPSSAGKAIVTVEEKNISYNVIDFSKTNIMEFSIEINETHRDGFNICAYYLDEKGVKVERKKIAYIKKDKYLTLSVESDKEEYSPGEDAKFIIKVSDSKDKPVSSQVTAGIIDSSIYSINKEIREEIQKFFGNKGMDNISCHVTRSDSLTCSKRFEKKDYYKEVMKMIMKFAGWECHILYDRNDEICCRNMCEEESLKAPDFTREEFLDTLYFNPNIITDHNGRAEITVPLAHNLTTWRATVIGITKDTMTGETIKDITVIKKLFARIITPRFFRERDEPVISGIIHNYLSSEKTVIGKLIIEGPVELLDRGEYKITVPSGKTAAVMWNIKVSGEGSCSIKLSALTDEESDEVKITLPVLPHGCERTISMSGSTDKEGEEIFNLPLNGNRLSARSLIILEPSIASSILSSIKYLVGFPYGCVEQTMSRFLPNVIVSKAFKELDLSGYRIENLSGMVRAGQTLLYTYHHTDGGWGWWAQDKSQPFMTAYVIYGLALAKEAGHSVNTRAMNSGIKWMENHYKKEYNPDTKAFMAFSSTVAGTLQKDWLTELFDKRHELDNYAKSVLALSLEKSNLHEEAKIVIELIEESAEITADIAMWKGKPGRYGWTDSMVETTAYCLKALLAIKKDSHLIKKSVRFLSTQRKGNKWNSTKDTAAVLMALIDYLKYTGEIHTDFTTDLVLNGKSLESLSFNREDVGREGKQIICREELNRGENSIRFKLHGQGTLYYSIYSTYYTEEEAIKGSDGGFNITRRYFISDSKGTPCMLDDYPFINVNLYDAIRVTLTIKGKPEYEYVMIEDPKPAGCEILENKGCFYRWGDGNYDVMEFEVRDDRSAFFFPAWYSVPCEITYFMKLETMGTFHVMPARVSLMYNPDINGISDEIILETPFTYTGRVREILKRI